MVLPGFAYTDPGTLPAALQILADYQDRAKVLAGGQTLIPILSMGMTNPEVLVDIGRLTELRYQTEEGGELRIGALSRHRDLERSPLLAGRCPLLSRAAGLIGHSHIRARGTIGGSLAHADPAAEYPVAMLALDARFVLQSSSGRREVLAADFLLGPLLTDLRPDELLVEVRLAAPATGAGWAMNEMVQRSGDFALVCSAAWLQLEGGTIRAARIAVGGAGPTAVRCRQAEAVLTGQPPAVELFAQAAAVAAAEVQPEDDIHASAAYRRELTRLYVRDTLGEAAGRAETA